MIAHLATGTDAEDRAAAAAADAGALALRRRDHRHHPRFCQRMLDGVGVAGDYQPDARRCVEYVADLLGEVSDDRLRRRLQRESAPTLTPEDRPHRRH